MRVATSSPDAAHSSDSTVPQFVGQVAVGSAGHRQAPHPRGRRGREKARTGRAFRHLEDRYDALVGVYAIDVGTGRSVSRRPDDRFAYASTCKTLLAGAVLPRFTLRGIDRLVRFRSTGRVAHSPVTVRRLDSGLTLRELCDASVRHSDNTAANLHFRELAGPGALRQALEALDDRTPRGDRYETQLSEAAPAIRGTPAPHGQ